MPDRARLVFIPLLIVFVAVSLVGAAMYTPSLPAIAAGFGAPVATVQLTVSVYLIGFAIAQLFVGALSDRYGRKPVLLAGFLLFIVASTACALAPSVQALIAARLFQAIGASVGIVVTRAIIRDRFGATGSARYMAYLGMAAGLTPALSPTVGGIVQVSAGWRGVFHTMSGLGVVALLTALVALRESHLPEARIRAGLRGMLTGFGLLLRHWRFLAYTVAAATPSAMFFVFLAAGPVVMIGPAGVAPDVYGFYALCMPGGYITGNFLSSRITPRVGIDRAIAGGNLIAVAGAVAMAAIGASGYFTPLAFALPLVVMGFGNGIAVPAAYAGVVEAEPRLAGTASGLTGFLQFAYAAGVNPLAGLVRHAALNELGWILFGLAVAGAAVFRLLLRLDNKGR